MSASARGRFVTLEGVDGAGKSTHASWLAERLRAAGRRVVLTREPGGTPLGERIRELLMGETMDPIAETLLLFAARSDHLRRVIRPALERGDWVVCDRFTDATYAYQGAAKGVPEEFIAALERRVQEGLRPDLTIVFDCSYETSRGRLLGSGRGSDRFESQGLVMFERVRSWYLHVVAIEPGRVKKVDAQKGQVEVKKQLDKILTSTCNI